MPQEFYEELDPRSVIPISDAEIERIYRSVAAREEAVHIRTRWYKDKQLRDAFLGDALIWMVVLLALLIRREPLPVFMLLLLTGAAVSTACFALLSSGIPCGLFTALQLERRRSGRKAVDVSDPRVLSRVVDHIIAGPLDHAADIERRIQGDRQAVARSLAELGSILVSLKDELKLAESDSIKMLLQARLESAETLSLKLRELDGDLAVQLRETANATKPVRNMKANSTSTRELGTVSRASRRRTGWSESPKAT